MEFDFKQSFIYDQNPTVHDLEFLKRENFPADYDSPSNVQQLDAESPNDDCSPGLYDKELGTHDSRSFERFHEMEGISDGQRLQKSSNSEGSGGKFASGTDQQLTCGKST